MKIKKTIVVLLVFILLLIVTSCSINKRIEAKYISIYDKNSYLLFKKDGSFINSSWTTINDGKEIIRDCFIYNIDKNDIITATDITEYEGQDSLNEYEIGIMFKDYICVSWNGILSNDYTDMTISNQLSENLILTFTLKEDKTYEYIVTSNNEIANTERGTYLIDNNEIVCTSNEGTITTFVNIDGNTYSVEYIKED